MRLSFDTVYLLSEEGDYQAAKAVFMASMLAEEGVLVSVDDAEIWYSHGYISVLSV